MKKFVVLSLMAIFCAAHGEAQTGKRKPIRRPGRVIAPPPPPVIFTVVDQLPEFAGDARDFLQRNMRYPESARESNEEGKAIVRFMITETGGVDSVAIFRSSGSPRLDAEALRVTRAMPAWKPARTNGRAVRMRMELPVVFRLR